MDIIKGTLIPHIEIAQNNILSYPLWFFDTNNSEAGSLNSYDKNIKDIINYNWGNKHYRWSNIYGDEFSFSVCFNNNIWKINIWDYKGTTAIIALSQKTIDKNTDVLTSDNYNKLKEISEKFSKDIINCSDCKIEIKKSEAAGRYFAGVYCNKCWEGKWKAIEAKETYD